MKYHEQAVGQTSEWRTPKFIFDALRLQFAVDPCAPMDGFYCVPADRRLTMQDDGLRQPWGKGSAFVNPPWSGKRRAVVPWLEYFFFKHDDGGVFVCVARTSCDWFHELVFPNAELLLFSAGKTRFAKPNGSFGEEPTNGICLIGKGAVCCEALRKSGLGFCVIVDRNTR
jgi:hypothetical protein